MNDEKIAKWCKNWENVGREKIKRMLKKKWVNHNIDIYDKPDEHKKEIKELNKAFSEKIEQYAPKNKMVNIPKTAFGANMYCNFIGRWYFDIIFGHNKVELNMMKELEKEERKQQQQNEVVKRGPGRPPKNQPQHQSNQPKPIQEDNVFVVNEKEKYVGFDYVIKEEKQTMYGIFLEANSKYVRGWEMKDKTHETCKEVFNKFMQWVRDNNVLPVKEIICDAEPGMKGIDNRIHQIVADKNHHVLGPIDGFVNALRQWNWKNTHDKAVDVKHFDYFVQKIWNQDIVKGTNYTRRHMVMDEEAQECYICGQIYKRAEQNDKREELASNVGAEVKLTFAEKKGPFERRPGKLMVGKYTIVGRGDRGRLKVKDEKGQEQDVYYTQVAQMNEKDAKKMKTLNLVHEPPPKIQNVNKLAQYYEKELRSMKEDLTYEVLREITNRNNYDMKLGFMPMVRTNELNKAYVQAKNDLEVSKRAPLIGYKKEVHKSSVKRLAKDVVNGLFNNYDGIDGSNQVFKNKRKKKNQPEAIAEPHIGND